MNRAAFGGLAATLFFMISCVTTAQNAIGFVDIQEVVRKSKIGRAAAMEIETYVEQEARKIAAIESDLRLLRRQVESLSPESPTQQLRPEQTIELQNKTWEYERRFQEFEAARALFEQARDLRNRQLLSRLLPKINEAIMAVAKREGYLAIFSGNVNDFLLYKDVERDVTLLVVNELDS